MESKRFKKIDAHSHIGDFGGWANVSINAEELIDQMKEYNIEKTILCGTSHLDNENILEAYNDNKDKIIPLVFLNPYDGDKAIEQLESYVDKGFKGIKLHPLANSFVADDEILDPIMKKAEELEIPVFIHCGHPPFSLPWCIGLLAERFPKVDIVMIHMGHGHGVYIDGSIKMAKRYSNIFLEMSGMPMQSKIKEAYETVGNDRIMFGIDAPFHHPTIEIQKVMTSELDEKGLEDVFYNNAFKLMKL